MDRVLSEENMMIKTKKDKINEINTKIKFKSKDIVT